MAVVFLAHDLSLNRKVAIKALLPELLYTEGMDRRFKHEARVAAKLDHPNILVIHGVREANDLLFIVMKLVEGLPLSAIVKVAGPLPIPVVRTIIRHVADALSYAHGEGVIHRDVKPANVMVDRRGNVVVMDFGIAKAADDAHLTRTGLVIGTPAYMSPEQCLAKGVTSASDQYSLGVVAYELLTGQTPFRGSALEMQWAHATAAPPSMRSLRSDCPPELDAIVLRMLAKSPADRWPTLHDVSHALGDDPSTIAAARSALIALVNEVPGRRDPTMPTTPASPVPIGPGPVAAGNATTDPVRAPMDGADRGTGSPTAPPNAAVSASPILTLSQQRIELTTGDSVELVVDLEPHDTASDSSTVEWQSSNPAVAAVSRDGLVTATGPGLAEIACAWRGRRAVCLVHVAAAVAAIETSPAVPSPRSRATTADARAERVPAGASVAPDPSSGMSMAGHPRRLWWVGVLAAGVVAVAVLRGVLPRTATRADGDAAPSTGPLAPAAPTGPVAGSSTAASPSPTSARPPSNPPEGASSRLPNAGQSVAGRTTLLESNPTGRAGAANGRTPPPAQRTASGPRAAAPSSPPAASPAPPNIPPARMDSVRLTNRLDTSGYGASRSAAATSTPASAAAGRDSASDKIPAAPREIASALFKEFANAVNARAYSRVTSAYPQPSDPAAARVWQDFLVFVRDYTPRATVRSTTVNESSDPPTITAAIDFRWTSDNGFDRMRTGTFVGIGVPIPGGWQLRGVRMAKKFW